MKVNWAGDADNAFAFSAVAVCPKHHRYRLQVEKLSTGDWDWLVWTEAKASRYGIAQSAQDAMAAAEAALAKLWEPQMHAIRLN